MIGEGSSSRKRGLSPPVEGDIANKRARTPGASKSGVIDTHREETRPSKESKRAKTREEHGKESGDTVSYSSSRSFAEVM